MSDFRAPTGRGNDFYVTTQVDAATAVDRWAFIAARRCKLLGVAAVWDTVGGASAAVLPRKVTDASAPDATAGATVLDLTTAFDLTATVNTVVEKDAIETGQANVFEPGDKLGESYTGTVSGLIGCVIVYRFLAL